MDAYSNILKKLVNIPSVTNDKRAVNMVNDILIRHLSKHTLMVRKISAPKVGDLVIAKAPLRKGAPNILLTGHTDIVPTPVFNCFQKKGSKYYGNGIADMKGGLLVLLGIVDALVKMNILYNTSIIFVPDEESGSRTHRDTLLKIYKKFDYACVFEPGLQKTSAHWKKERWIVTKRRGVSQITVAIKGEGGHAGNKVTDRQSTIEELAHKIPLWHALNNPSKGISVNVGLCEGGEAANVIAANAKAVIDLRVTTRKQYSVYRKKIEAIALKNKFSKTNITIDESFFIPPLEENNKSKYLKKIITNICQKQGCRVVNNVRGGGSDGNQIAEAGVGVIDALGPVGVNLHTSNEWIYKESMQQSMDIVTKMIFQIRRSNG